MHELHSLPTLILRVYVNLFSGVVREFIDKFRMSGVKSGARDPDFTIAHLQLGHRGSWVSLRVGKPDPYIIVGEVKGLSISGEFAVVFEALNIWGDSGALSYCNDENAVVVAYRDYDEAVAASFSGTPSSGGLW